MTHPLAADMIKAEDYPAAIRGMMNVKKQNQPTVDTVAKCAWVSKSTVSKALNNCLSVSTDTKAKVLKAANAVQYAPALQKQAVSVGIVMPGAPQYFWGQVMQGAKEAAHEHSVTCRFALYGSGEQDALHALNSLPGTDALLVMPTGYPSFQARLRALVEEKPMVLINGRVEAYGSFYVGEDGYQDGRRLAQVSLPMLWEYPRLICLDAEEYDQMARLRVQGFLDTVREQAPDVVLVGNLMIQDTSRCMAARLARLLEPFARVGFDSVFVSSGIVAQVCQALRKMGIAGRIKCVGFENPPANREFWQNGTIYALVAQDARGQGRRGVELLSRYVSEKVLPQRYETFVPSQLLVRRAR